VQTPLDVELVNSIYSMAKHNHLHCTLNTYNVTNIIQTLSAHTDFSLHKQPSSHSHIPYC